MTNATQIVVIGVFIFFLVIAVIVFAAFGTTTSSEEAAQSEIWGVMPSSVFSNIANNLNAAKPGSINIKYREIDNSDFESTLVNALAEGTGPDAILIPSDLMVKLQKKLALISFDAYPQSDFKESFIQGAELLLTHEGTYGLPFLVDPLVMYFNRDILNSNGVASAPTSWEQVLALSEKLTTLSEDRTVLRSTVPFGDYTNVTHAKDILATLMIQSGNPLVIRDSAGKIKNLMAESSGAAVGAIETALDFYTQFADPLKPIYTWNRGLTESKQAFVNGDLAFYFGPASELLELQSKNPNLNFDVATIPQPQNANVKRTGGSVYSFAVLATSNNQRAALGALLTLTSPEVVALASNSTHLPPARRDLLSQVPGTGSGSVFYRSALWTTTWLDPDPVQSDKAFQSAVDSIVTGSERVTQSSKSLASKIDEIIRTSKINEF